MASIKTKVIRKSRTQSVKTQYEASARQIVGAAGNLVRNTAVDSINQGGRSGVTYERGGKTAQRSAAGEPPKTDQGILAGSIRLKLDANNLGASVESGAKYSEALEFGTSKMAARPFLQPALEANRSKIRALEAKLFKAK
jgi:HK97 gp10 family phage protein